MTENNFLTDLDLDEVARAEHQPRRAAPPKEIQPGRRLVVITGIVMIVTGLALGGWVWIFGGLFPKGPAAATSPQKAVQGYLAALAAGDARGALGYAAKSPADTTLLTSEVLSAALANYPMTILRVDPPQDDTVPAAVQFGVNSINASFRTVQTGFVYRIENAVTEVKFVGLTPVLPLKVQNQPVTTTSVLLFPGMYDLTSDSKYLAYDIDKVVVGPNGTMEVPLRPLITESGKQAVRASAAAQLQLCLESTSPKPPGCVVNFVPPEGVTLVENGLKYSLTGEDPLANLEIVEDPTSPGILKLPIEMELRILATGTDGKSYTANEQFKFLNVDLRKEQIVVTFTHS